MKSFIKSHRLSLSFDRFGDSDQDSRYELFPELLGSGDSKYASTHQSRDRNIQPSSSRRFSEYHVRSKHNPDLSSPHSPTSPSSYSLKKFNPISYIRKRCSSEEYKRSSYIPSVEEYKEAGAIFGTRVHNWDSRTSTSNTSWQGRQTPPQHHQSFNNLQPKPQGFSYKVFLNPFSNQNTNHYSYSFSPNLQTLFHTELS